MPQPVSDRSEVPATRHGAAGTSPHLEVFPSKVRATEGRDSRVPGHRQHPVFTLQAEVKGAAAPGADAAIRSRAGLLRGSRKPR